MGQMGNRGEGAKQRHWGPHDTGPLLPPFCTSAFLRGPASSARGWGCGETDSAPSSTQHRTLGTGLAQETPAPHRRVSRTSGGGVVVIHGGAAARAPARHGQRLRFRSSATSCTVASMMAAAASETLMLPSIGWDGALRISWGSPPAAVWPCCTPIELDRIRPISRWCVVLQNRLAVWRLDHLPVEVAQWSLLGR